MGSSIKNFVKKTFPKLSIYYRFIRLLVRAQNSYLNLTGWTRSIKESRPVDKDGGYIPWMTYPAIRLLRDRLRKDIRLFEFGSGYSTLFYAGRVQTVTSVEYDQSWFEIIRKQAPANTTLVYQPKDVDGRYCRTILTTQIQYDVVIVDGRDRVNCIKQSIGALSENGVIILDDSHRERYQEGIRHAKERGFRELCLEGLKPTSGEMSQTSIIYRSGNCLDI